MSNGRFFILLLYDEAGSRATRLEVTGNLFLRLPTTIVNDPPEPTQASNAVRRKKAAQPVAKSDWRAMAWCGPFQSRTEAESVQLKVSRQTSVSVEETTDRLEEESKKKSVKIFRFNNKQSNKA